ncbi:MAG: hypothetical protein ACUVUG_04885 [Candidatus Aminicenantia bacterium]
MHKRLDNIVNNNKIVKGFVLMFLLIVSLLLFLESPAYAVGDIFCNYDNKRYDNPNECVPKCKVRMKNPMGGCFLSPQCGRLLKYNKLKQFYNQAVFLRGSVPRPYSYIVLVKYIIDNVIESPDVKSNELDIRIGSFDCQFYMRIINDPTTMKGGQKRYPFLIKKESFFELSPAYLILGIIHEIQHLSQFKAGTHNPEFTGDSIRKGKLVEFVHAFGELEVSYYETQSGLIDCLTEEEKEDVKWRKDYWEWKVKEAIEGIAGHPALLNQAEEWFKSNTWTWDTGCPKILTGRLISLIGIINQMNQRNVRKNKNISEIREPNFDEEIFATIFQFATLLIPRDTQKKINLGSFI